LIIALCILVFPSVCGLHVLKTLIYAFYSSSRVRFYHIFTDTVPLTLAMREV
jgi:hypothetical protein